MIFAGRGGGWRGVGGWGGVGEYELFFGNEECVYMFMCVCVYDV